MKRALILPLCLFCLLFIAVVIGFQYGETTETMFVKGFRYWANDKYTRVVVDLSGPVKFTHNILSNPDRLYFDLANCSLLNNTIPSLPIENGILKEVRAGQFKHDTVRVVLDLQEIDNFTAFLLEGPHRLVIDVFGKRNNKPGTGRKDEERFQGIIRVIIDPGHGGEDPGAIGPRGLLEKDVVLKVAKQLGGLLKEKYGMEVIFTRDTDVFIPLEERTAVANSKKGDIFISLHANASKRRDVRGIETYFLNWTTDNEAMRVAARENAVSLRKMQQAQNALQMILLDLERENKKDESMKLAYTIQNRLVGVLGTDYPEVVDLGVKYALFYVLVGAEMPSVLVEVSFISNYEEERRLSDNGYREKIAEAIAEGIRKYAVPSKLVERKSDKT